MLLNLPLGKCFQRFNQSILFTLTRRNLNTISLEIQEFCCTKLKQKKAFTPTRRNLQTISSDVQSHWHNKLTQAKVESPDVSIREIKKCVEANYPPNQHTAIFEDLCRKRQSRLPLQYVIGEWDFRHVTLEMKPPIFIPRQETEGLIDLINDDLKSCKGGDYLNILEVGIGSGAISLSILKENAQVSCTALDVLKEAVDLSTKNAERLHLSNRLKVYHSSIETFDLSTLGVEPFDMLISNPPYIPSKEMVGLQEEVRYHESHLALDGGPNGLDVVTSIFKKGHSLLKPGSSVWLEVDEQHPKELQQMIQSSFPAYQYLQSYRDCFGRPRFCHLQYNP